ncbi:MAG: hypothetical protein HY999_01980 [Nitrospinae bacterium]|nr:hypothetical protein [Nitrospinota bacterium]
MKREYEVFVSMPFGESADDPNNEWTKLFRAGIEPFKEEIQLSFQSC